jgi:flagellar basal-body rod protein FlgC
MSLLETLHISASGMRAESERLKIVSQNVANARTTSETPGGMPYLRQTISFKQDLDRETGAIMVKVDKIGVDRKSQPIRRYEPENPVADAQGYVLYPNVNSIMEMMDMREARRGYEANLDVVQSTKTMLSQTLNLLK